MKAKLVLHILLTWIGVAASIDVFSQHNVDFQLPSEVCLNELLAIENQSDSGTQTQWNFCASELSGTYTSITIGSITTFITDLAIAEDNDVWFGFATSRSGGIYQINFGNSPYNAPSSIANLGTLGGLLDQPESISLIKEGSDWYGLVVNQNDIIRLNWGASLSGTPAAQSLNVSAFNKLSNPTEIEIAVDDDRYVAAIANSGTNTISLVNFGLSITNIPAGSDIIVSDVLPGASDLSSVTISRVCEEWILYGIATNRIYKITVGMDLFSQITTSDIVDFSAAIPVTIGQYNRIKSIVYGQKTYVYFASYTGAYVYAAVWEQGQSSPSFSDLGNQATPLNPYVLESFFYSGHHGLLVSGFLSGITNRIEIISPCNANVQYNNSIKPNSVFYTQPGTYEITLTTTFSDGIRCSRTHSVIVNSKPAPLISMTVTNECLSSPILFDAINNGSVPINNWNWNFGDSNSGSGQSTNNSYVLSGNYDVKLSATSVDGCSNYLVRTLSVFEPPEADFLLPTPAIVCTNQDYIFQNNTSFDAGSNLQWQWTVNGVSVSSAENLVQTFSTVITNHIELIASIPGCFSTKSQDFTIQHVGPHVDFSVAGNCQDADVQFTNGTMENDLTYAWDFGDGSNASQASITHNYSGTGDFTANLQATNPVGCQNWASKIITIYSKPHPDFSVDLPPFSCSGSLSQFNDLTPSLTDSNISSWLWKFGDEQNGTSGSQHAQYTYTAASQFNVSLTTTSNFGCSATTQKQVTIQQSPLAAFTNSVACLNVVTSFIDTSSGSIKSRFWNIGTNTYTTPSVLNTFMAPGNFQVVLTVTGNNNCVATSTKTIAVPAPPVLDFSVQNNCSTQNAIFTDITPTATDPITTRAWDFANQGIASGSPVQHLFASTGIYSVKMTATSQSGCSYPLTKNVVITKTPTANFTASVESGPPPLPVQFNNTSSNATSYLWEFNDLDKTTSSQLSPSFIFTTLGDYLVKLMATSLQGCKETFSKAISVIVAAPDLAVERVDAIHDVSKGTIKMSISLYNKGNTVISGSMLLLDVSGVSLLKENVATAIQPGQTFIYVTNAEIVLRADEIQYLCAEVSAGGDQDLSNNKECISVENELVYFSPYPNPTEGALHLDWITSVGSHAGVEIVNSFGQKVYHKKIDATREGLNQLELDVSIFSSGVYIIIFQTGETKKSFKFSIL